MHPALVWAGAAILAAPGSARWRLDVSVGTLRPVAVAGADGRSHAYWGCVVELKNGTGEPRPLVLAARLLTETKKIAAAVFRPDADEALRAALGEAGEGLRNLVVSRGEIAPGETQRFLAVFEDVDPVATRLDVRIAGAAASVLQDGIHWIAEQWEWSTLFERRGDDYETWSHPIRRVKEQWILLASRRIR